MSLDTTFAALSDPTRRAIIAKLGAGPATISAVAAPFAMSLSAVLKHLAVLETGGLITRHKQGRTVTCRLNAAGLRTAHSYLGDYESFWSAGPDRLETLLLKAGVYAWPGWTICRPGDGSRLNQRDSPKPGDGDVS